MTILQHGIAQAAGGGGYQIARSLRFNSADTAYLSRTPGSAGNRQKFTYSTWVKLSSLASAIQRVFNAGVTNYFGIDFGYSAGEFNINVDVGPDPSRSQNYTTATFRDPSAWYHIVIAVDTTQATAANRLKIYVNNVLYSYSSTATIPQNVSTDVNNTAEHNIGRRTGGTDRYCNMYMADIRIVDGQQLDPTSFGEFDANTGVWSPKTYSGTYGTNGFWLKLDDNSAATATTLGKDSSGNSNNWTPNNFSVTAGVGNDSLVDSPTNYGTDTGAGGEVRGNYCTMNPLNKNSSITLANGNLDVSSSGAAWKLVTSTVMLPPTGKWYVEITQTSTSQYVSVGVVPPSMPLNNFGGATADSWAWQSSAQKYNNNVATSYGTTAQTNGDVIMFAIDRDNGKLWAGKNGTWFASGNPAGNANEMFASIPTTDLFVAISQYDTASCTANFGQRPFAYTAPSGFKALCTQNLPTPAIGATSSTLASKNMNVVTYSGNSSTQTITTDFQPDLVWIKSRSTADIHTLQDVLRGARYYLQSNSSTAEATQPDSDGVSAFTSTGFTLGYTDSDAWNKSSNTYVAWNWKAGGTAVTNTAGSISSQVSANPTAGISVVTFTGNGTAGATVGHGLGVAPAMVIVKYRGGVGSWAVYHKSLGATQWLTLNGTGGATTSAQEWNNTAPTSSVFSIGSSSANSNQIGANLAYCFAEVAGFSKFGSYTGNGSADGPFVYCGFRPRYVVIKNTSGGSWEQYDTARDSYNQASLLLEPNSSGAEATAAGYVLDFVSNGFKIRGAGTGINTNANTLIFAAFAEAPFNYSRAR